MSAEVFVGLIFVVGSTIWCGIWVYANWFWDGGRAKQEREYREREYRENKRWMDQPEKKYNPPPPQPVPTAPWGQDAAESVKVSEWRLENKTLVRTYEFSDLPPPETKTSLELHFYVSRDLSGATHTSLSFYLRPYLYLMPDTVSIAH
jgi:hypothetical protein